MAVYAPMFDSPEGVHIHSQAVILSYFLDIVFKQHECPWAK